MSLIKCPECGKDVSDKAKACPNCGHPIQSKIKRHPKWVIVLAAICGIIALFVCISAFLDLKKAGSVGKANKETNASFDSKAEITETDISSESKTEITETKETQQPKVSFSPITDEELSTLPDPDGFVSSVSTAAKSIGVTDIVKTEIGNYKKSDIVLNLSAKCETETGAELIIDSLYVTKWVTFSIIDYNTGNYYFADGDKKDFIDLYDYKTGKLISEKTKDWEDYDALEEFNKRSQEIDQEFQESLNEIAEKYTNSSTKNDNAKDVSHNNIDMKSFSKDIEVINEYKWDSYGLNYIGIELKNNSASTLRLDSEFIFYDADNNIIGTKKTHYVAFEPQSNILLHVANEDPFDHYECNLNPKEDNRNNPVKSLLKSEVSEADSKLIFSITNTGDFDALFVKCTVLFLQGGEPVSLKYSYAGTSNGKILPSETERAEIKKPYNTPYDEYILFLDGRG